MMMNGISSSSVSEESVSRRRPPSSTNRSDDITADHLLSAIEALKLRKARPDKNRIAHHLERKHNFSREDVFAALARSVADGSVLKVKYKDFYSYRNPNKVVTPPSVTTTTTTSTTTTATNNSDKSDQRSPASTTTSPPDNDNQSKNGHHHSGRQASARQRSLHSSAKSLDADDRANINAKECSDTSSSTDQTDPYVDIDHTPTTIKSVHNNKKDSGLISNVSLDNQANHSSRKGLFIERKKGTDKSESIETTNSHRKLDEQAMQRGRPVSQRKKIKKSLGPDFLDPSDLGYQYLKDTYGPKCQYCDSPILSNKQDRHLSCGKCGIKAHLRCLSAGAENTLFDVTEWFCEKCVTICSLCGLTNENEDMYICNQCESPFHVLCCQVHWEDPLLLPRDEWTCRQCRTKRVPMGSKTLSSNKEYSPPKPCDDDLFETIQNEVPESEHSKENHSSVNSKSLIEKQNFVNVNLLKTIRSFSIDPDPQNWTAEDVETYIREIGFPEQAPLFREQLIDGKSLLLLRRMDVLRGLSMKLGPALKIYAHINQLQASDFELISSTLNTAQSDK